MLIIILGFVLSSTNWLSLLVLMGCTLIGLSFQRLLHGLCSLLDQLTDDGGNLIGQQVSNPDKPTVILTLGENLHRSVMVRGPSPDCRVSKSTSLIVKIDDQLADHQPIRKGHNSGVSIKASSGKDAWGEALVYRTDIANCRPHVIRAGVDENFFGYKSFCETRTFLSAHLTILCGQNRT